MPSCYPLKGSKEIRPCQINPPTSSKRSRHIAASAGGKADSRYSQRYLEIKAAAGDPAAALISFILFACFWSFRKIWDCSVFCCPFTGRCAFGKRMPLAAAQLPTRIAAVCAFAENLFAVAISVRMITLMRLSASKTL